MNNIDQRIQEQLEKRKRENAFRKLPTQFSGVDFCSNDYLGLSGNADLMETIHQSFIHQHSKKMGATGSRLISGNHPFNEILEDKLARFFESEAALLFNSGYQANMGLLSSLPHKGDTILYDQYIHASLREGTRLSFARSFSFLHNNLADLEKKIKKSEGRIFVVVESLYSMNGDLAPIAEIATICQKHKAHLIVDEAHSTGIYGNSGEGYCIEKSIHEKCFARIHTFGKAIGSHGACIVGSALLKDYLINFSKPFIYTTALPLHNLVSIDCAFDYLIDHPELKKQLVENIKLFKFYMTANGLEEKLKASNTPIQILRIPGNNHAKNAANALYQKGFEVKAILSPTVSKGEECLRICIHAFNTDEEIIAFTKALQDIIKTHNEQKTSFVQS